jgi:hypothetical protein
MANMEEKLKTLKRRVRKRLKEAAMKREEKSRKSAMITQPRYDDVWWSQYEQTENDRVVINSPIYRPISEG